MLVGIIDAQGNRCQKDVAVVINAAPPPSGPDWSTLVWDTVLFGGGDVAFASALGANLIWDLSGAADGSSAAFLTLHASMTYTGPAVNCKVAVTLTAGNAFTTLAFGIRQDGVPVLAVGDSGDPPGSTDYNFSLLAGVNSVIAFQTSFPFAGPTLAYGAILFLSFPAGIINGSATISNVP
jgi:hypothetical protein